MYPHETRGKFAGHTAEFTAEYKVELQDGYKIEDFQKNTTTRSLPDKPEKPTKPVLAQIHWYQLLGYSRKALIIFILGIAFIIGTTIKT